VITPPVGGAQSITRSSYFVLGGLVGAALTASALIGIGILARHWPVTLPVSAMFLACTSVLIALAQSPFPVPSGNWIIPRRWQAYGGNIYALVFGLNLGLGWRTRVTSHAFWFLMLAGALTAQPRAIAVAMCLFSLARTIPVVGLVLRRRWSIRSGLAEAKALRSLASGPKLIFAERLTLLAFAASMVALQFR
jgi:hypothetical protein